MTEFRSGIRGLLAAREHQKLLDYAEKHMPRFERQMSDAEVQEINAGVLEYAVMALAMKEHQARASA